MKRLDEDKVSLVQFMKSIRFGRRKSTRQPTSQATSQTTECPTHFAHFNPQARPSQGASVEDQQLIRSAN